MMVMILLLAASCKKPQTKSSLPTPTPTPTVTPTPTPTITPTASYSKKNLNKLFSALKSTPQSFTVTAGTYRTVVGAAGTILKFYPNSFKDASGTIITSGTITIKLTEMYKPGQMIANRATTTANGELLRSGGQVYISATKSGSEVYANKYGIAFEQPGSSGQPMNLFYGNTNNADSVTTWTAADTTKAGVAVSGTVVDSFSFRYEFDSCTDFRWVNCDYFYRVSAGSLTNISVVVPDTSFNYSNTQVFLVFPTENIATYLGSYDFGTHAFSLQASYKIPIGSGITLVAITNKNGVYYFYKQTGITVSSNMTLNATMISQTLTTILSQLSTL
jgi:hypothetical protein